MKVKLLKKLRKEANKKYYIKPTIDDDNGNIGYFIYERLPFNLEFPEAYKDSFERAQELLYAYRRSYILIRLLQMRGKRQNKR